MGSIRKSIVFALVALVGTVGVSVGGCASSGQAEYARASDTAANVTIGPRYEFYVRSDPTLTIDQRDSHLFELKKWRDATASAMRDIGAEPTPAPVFGDFTPSAPVDPAPNQPAAPDPTPSG